MMSTPKSSELNLFKDRLRSLRGSKSKAAFAREIGVSPPLYHQWENGSKPTIDKAALIADKCNVTVEWLLNGQAPPVPQEPLDVKAALQTAIDGLHEKIGLQERIIDSQRQVIESQQQTISALNQTIEEIRQGRAEAARSARIAPAGGTKLTA